MKNRSLIGSLLVAVLALATLTAQAQNYIYKADNGTSLDQGGSWVGGNPPGVADVAAWNNTVLTPANCTNTLAAAATWAGISVINSPAAAVKITTNSANPTLSLGSTGTAGSGLDLSTAGTDLWVAPSITTAGDQTWTIPTGRTVILGDVGKNVNLQHSVTLSGGGTISLYYNLRLGTASGAGTLTINSGSIEPNAGNATRTFTGLVVGNSSAGPGPSTVTQTGGSVKVTRSDGTTGSPKTAMQIGGSGSSVGVYTITGGSLTDTSTRGTSTINLGDGSSSTGTLNVDGTAVVTVNSIRLANAASATGTLNVTNGTVMQSGSTFDIGRTTSGVYNSGTVNLYGGKIQSVATVALPHGNGPGYLNILGGTFYCNGLAFQDSSGGTGSGTATVSGTGALFVTNDIALPQGATAGVTGTFNLDGGTVTVRSFTHPSANTGTLNFNGGTLKAKQNRDPFIVGGIVANVVENGAVIDTAGYDVNVVAPLLHGSGGSPDGGLTKLGGGALTLSGANTYTAATKVQAGALYLNTTNHGGGDIAVSSSATLRTTLAASGTTLSCSALTLGNNPAGSVYKEFDCGANANPTVPLVYATNLTVTGTAYLAIYGTALTGGGPYIPLIKYDTINTASGTFAFSFAQGIGGTITNDTSAKIVGLIPITLPTMIWRALANTNWDTTSLNWVDPLNNVIAFQGGAPTVFDDSTSNALVNVPNPVFPISVTINNSARNYVFASATGAGLIGGTTGVTKQGSGTVTMALTNDYAGDTTISSGTFRLGCANAIPSGSAVAVEGTLDLAGFSDAILSLNGNSGVIDNSGINTAVLGVGGGNSTFAGVIGDSGASLALSKSGAAGSYLALLNRNTYSGGTALSGGLLQLAYEQSIGTGPLMISGGILAWTDTSAHSLTNPLTISGGCTLGFVTNGLLTVTGTADFAGGGRSLNCGSDAAFPAGFANGWLSGKSGNGTLTIKNTESHNPSVGGSGTVVFGSGATIFDNSQVIQELGNIRIRAGADNETSRVVITNGSSLTMTNTAGQNFLFNDGGSALNTINILDVAGTVTLVPYAGNACKLRMGSSSDLGGENILNLLPGGVLQVKQVWDQSSASISTVNFDGGTLSPNTNDYASTFMEYLDNCYVLDRGAFIDTAGWSITLGQALVTGGTGIGGLTKNGAGTLTLAPTMSMTTYGGPTVINGGTLALGSNEQLLYSPSITVNTNASLDLSASVGFSLIGKSLNLKIARQGGAFTSGMVVATGSSLTYGGALTVTRTGDALMGGEVFKLFDAGTYLGAFTATNLPALTPPLGWDLSGLYVDGTIRVTGSVTPTSIGSVQVRNGTDLVISGSGGAPGTGYSIVASTNVAAALDTWTLAGSGVFGADGKFTNSIPISTNPPRQFIRLRVP